MADEEKMEKYRQKYGEVTFDDVKSTIKVLKIMREEIEGNNMYDKAAALDDIIDKLEIRMSRANAQR